MEVFNTCEFYILVLTNMRRCKGKCNSENLIFFETIKLLNSHLKQNELITWSETAGKQ